MVHGGKYFYTTILFKKFYMETVLVLDIDKQQNFIEIIVNNTVTIARGESRWQLQNHGENPTPFFIYQILAHIQKRWVSITKIQPLSFLILPTNTTELSSQK
uniref:Uncharacterized protein n=1 Tax=Micrurus lemniscatus lemniscatus TaxID=129467 RepID=A0A2D4I1Y4_MICLE